MKKILIAGAVLILIAFDSNAQSTDKIAALIDQLANACNKHDAKAFSECFAADADFTNVIGMQAHGRKNIEIFHQPLFASQPVPGVPSFHKAILKIEKKTIRYLTPDIAAIDIWWDQNGAVGSDAKPWPARKGLENTIAIKKNGEWVFVVFHNMDIGEFKPDK
jgi:uncharacterized protein (TIGR02246 family)